MMKHHFLMAIATFVIICYACSKETAPIVSETPTPDTDIVDSPKDTGGETFPVDTATDSTSSRIARCRILAGEDSTPVRALVQWAFKAAGGYYQYDYATSSDSNGYFYIDLTSVPDGMVYFYISGDNILDGYLDSYAYDYNIFSYLQVSNRMASVSKLLNEEIVFKFQSAATMTVQYMDTGAYTCLEAYCPLFWSEYSQNYQPGGPSIYLCDNPNPAVKTITRKRPGNTVETLAWMTGNSLNGSKSCKYYKRDVYLPELKNTTVTIYY